MTFSDGCQQDSTLGQYICRRSCWPCRGVYGAICSWSITGEKVGQTLALLAAIREFALIRMWSLIFFLLFFTGLEVEGSIPAAAVKNKLMSPLSGYTHKYIKQSREKIVSQKQRVPPGRSTELRKHSIKTPKGLKSPKISVKLIDLQENIVKNKQ